MSWISNLYQTYENNKDSIGVFEKKRNDEEFTLLPVAHTTQSAHIEVTLDDRGNFLSAKVVDKSDASTIIPCTEASASRAGIKPVPHPLFDKLIFIAGDYERFVNGGIKGTPHEDYMRQLREWCESSSSHPKVNSVYSYLSKGTLIEDLVAAKVLLVDQYGKLIEKRNKDLEERSGDKPEIFKVVPADQSGAFVRFSVNTFGDFEPRLWRDSTVQDSFVRYYTQNLGEIDLCYISGEFLPFADKHASRIRHSADMAKIISANDTSGFTFRGRFRKSRDAASISYDVSQKAHNALKWLIARQGHTIDGKVFLVWGTEESGDSLPEPFMDTFSLFGDDHANTPSGDSTHKELANQVKLALAGYRHDFDYKSHVNIMILDAATPGRLSIVYYRELEKEVYLQRLERWHQTCYWLHRYQKNQSFVGAPATRDIAFAIYGSRASDKMIKGFLERMLPSIIDGRSIPLDIVRNAVQRASNPVSMEVWEWEKTLSITCALVRKSYEKEGFGLPLDIHNTNRDYLFGRMLAIADVLERRALGPDEKRATNAIRYMSSFAQRPGRTWNIIQSNLQPYQARLGTEVGYYNRLLDEVGSKLNPEDYTDKSLSGLYLLGFYSQRHDLYTSKKAKQTEEQDASNTNDEQGDI